MPLEVRHPPVIQQWACSGSMRLTRSSMSFLTRSPISKYLVSSRKLRKLVVLMSMINSMSPIYGYKGYELGHQICDAISAMMARLSQGLILPPKTTSESDGCCILAMDGCWILLLMLKLVGQDQGRPLLHPCLACCVLAVGVPWEHLLQECLGKHELVACGMVHKLSVLRCCTCLDTMSD